MIAQKQVTVRLHAVIKNCDSLVMMGKRCVDQRHHFDQAAARAWLAREWGLLPSSVRGKDKAFALAKQHRDDNNCQCARCVNARE